MTYQRNARGGNFAERFETAGRNLSFSDDDSTETLTQAVINATRSEADGYSIGNPGQYAIFSTDLITGPLKVTVQEPLAGKDVDAPGSGKLVVEAQDDSSLTMTFDDGVVTIKVDTDADGAVDGTMTADWMDID